MAGRRVRRKIKLAVAPDRAAELRKAHQAYHVERDRIAAQREAAEARWWALVKVGGAWQNAPAPPQYPKFPEEIRGLPCGATTRKGKPCKRTDLERNGRCKFHGGQSTGPKTATGKARSMANLALRWRKRDGEAGE